VARTGTPRFSWQAVEPALVRKLLLAAYDQADQPEDHPAIRNLTGIALQRQAVRSLGRLPKTKLRPALTDVLVISWLPNAPNHRLKDLTEVVKLTLDADARRRTTRTKQERVTFLQDRKRTSNFTTNLWRAFITAHRVPGASATATSGVPHLRSPSRLDLVGLGQPSPHEPYPHQYAAWAALDALRSRSGRRSGLIVIPTGGGKTATMVVWLLRELQRRPNLRVLWIADQQELVDQAAREFHLQAQSAQVGFQRVLRAIHSQAGRASALADPDVHVVCTTRQSIMGNRFDRNAKANLATFVSRPTVVVVDEAHHAVSPSYQALITHLWTVGRGLMLVGLTATPWPAGYGRTAMLRTTFARRLAEVSTHDLVESGSLARPIVHTVTVEGRIDLTDQELAQFRGSEVPPTVARKLDRASRNSLVVQEWLRRQSDWGKTLVFACDTDHADSLGDAFQDRGVLVDVVHSAADVDRTQVLRDFRAALKPRVLVSVGMLLEGIDLPSARTAFLCRPTSSHIVLRQMIGRVLRGVPAGGDPEAHIVDFVDEWSRQPGVLSPVDIPNVPLQPAVAGEGAAEHRLPPVLAEDGATEVGPDLVRSISRSMAERVRVNGLTATLTSSKLVGFYDLTVRRIPVFELTRDAWLDVAAWALRAGRNQGTSPDAYFDRTPPPVPFDAEIDAFVAFCRSYTCAPPFTALNASIDVAATAQQLIDAGPKTEVSRVEWLRQAYEGSLARSFFPSLQSFIEAVEQEKLSRLGVIASGARPEYVAHVESPPSEKLRRDSSRELALTRLRDDTARRGQSYLQNEPEYEALLANERLPAIDWTKRYPRSTWAYWSWRTSTRARDKPIICINRALQAPKSQISDELLMYLIWHELCHHLTPGQGHDSEFRRLEGLWLNHAELDHRLDTLHELYDFPSAARPKHG
jgi:superfamily II DNA or RNA helicase